MKSLEFSKMQALGNDYIYINGNRFSPPNPQALARQMSDRHFGVGADGLVLIHQLSEKTFKMTMYNADGSESEMCGNALRSVGKYVFEKGLTKTQNLEVHTLSGVRSMMLETPHQRSIK